MRVNVPIQFLELAEQFVLECRMLAEGMNPNAPFALDSD
jgi:hypothetical protein